MDRLDSTHFMSYPLPPSTFPGKLQASSTSSASSDDQLSFGVGSRRPSSGGNYAEEYRVIDAASASRRPDSLSTPGIGDNDDVWIDADNKYWSVFQMVDFETLRIIFIALDALLLVHRITNVYVGVRLVSRRFGDGSGGGELIVDDQDDQLPVDVVSGNGNRRTTAANSNHRCGVDGTASIPLRRQQRSDVMDGADRARLQPMMLKYADGSTVVADAVDAADYLRPLEMRAPSTLTRQASGAAPVATGDYCPYRQYDGLPPTVPPPAFSTTFNAKYGIRRDNTADYFDTNTMTTSTTTDATTVHTDYDFCDVIKTVVAQMLQSGAVPKAIVAVVLTLVFYVVARSVVVVLDAGLLTAATSASMGLRSSLRVVDAVEVRVNETNRCIDDEARQLNEMAAAIYGSQLRVELVNLQALVEFFNAGMFAW